VMCATGLGLLMSTFTDSQIAAIFRHLDRNSIAGRAIRRIAESCLVAVGCAPFIGHIYPTTYFLTISRGTFLQGIGILRNCTPRSLLAAMVPVLTVASVLLLKKQGK
jgi:ribosome-dependent ATPase